METRSNRVHFQVPEENGEPNLVSVIEETAGEMPITNSSTSDIVAPDCHHVLTLVEVEQHYPELQSPATGREGRACTSQSPTHPEDCYFVIIKLEKSDAHETEECPKPQIQVVEEENYATVCCQLAKEFTNQIDELHITTRLNHKIINLNNCVIDMDAIQEDVNHHQPSIDAINNVETILSSDINCLDSQTSRQHSQSTEGTY